MGHILCAVFDQGMKRTRPAPRSRRIRCDSRLNHEALLCAARGLYATDGVDVPLETVARSAGVGIATLYRHFPRGKEQLIVEALVDQASSYLEAARRALLEADPWVGFVSFVEEICAMQQKHLGLAELLTMVLPSEEKVGRIRREANQACVELIARAKATGRLRRDFVAEDLILMLMANAAVVQMTGRDAPRASRRIVSLLLQAASSEGLRSPLPPAPSTAEMRRAMRHLAGNHGCNGVVLRGGEE